MDLRGFRVRLVLALLIVAGAVMPATAMASAQATSHMVMGQVSMTWNAPWTQDTTAGGTGPTFEQIWLDGPNGSVMIEVDVSAVPAQQKHDAFAAAFAAETPLQPVDQGSAGNITWWLDLIPYPGAPVGAYTLIRETPEHTTMALLIASVDGFGDGISATQAGVTVDGAPLFGGVDGAQLQQRLQSAAGGGQVAQAPTPTPATGLNPGSAPTPANVAPVTPTPAAQVAGASVPVSARAGQDVPETGPVTLAGPQAAVTWSEPWVPQQVSETSVRLWDAQTRVVAEVWTTTFALAPQSAVQFAQSELIASSGWTVEAAVDLVPGSRFGLTMSRDSGEAWLYQYAEVAVLESHLLVVSVTGWQGQVTAALPAVSGSLTVNGQPALTSAGQATALPTAKAPNPAEHWLFDSASMVAWTSHWSEAVLEPSGVRLIGSDGAPHYRIWDIAGGEPMAAAQMAESILGGAPEGATLYKAIDIIPGVRAMVVLQQPDAGGTRYHIFDTQFVNDQFQQGSTNQYITATNADFAGEIEVIRQNATLNSMPVFIDLENHVPELWNAGSTVQAGGQVTPTEVASGTTPELRLDRYAEGSLPSPLTIPTNGWTVAWSDGWYTEDDVEPENFVGLWSPTARARLVVYHFDWADPSAQAFAQGEVEFLSSGSPVPYTVASAVDVAPGHFHTIFSRTTNGQTFYSIYDVVVHDDGTMTGTILEAWDTDVDAALAGVQQAITTNGTPAMADVTLALPPPSTTRSDTTFPLFLSGRTVEWTGAWGEMYFTSTNFGLTGSSEGVPRFSTYDRAPGDTMTSAQWSQQLQGNNPGWTVYRALDLENGQRLLVVLQSDDGTRYAFNELDRSGTVPVEQLIIVRSDAVTEDLAFVQANVTVDDQVPMADIQTHVPELFTAGS